MIAGVLTLDWKDIQNLRITDPYSVHRAVYGLFADQRSEAQKRSHIPSGFLYADKGGSRLSRTILFLSDREPCQPSCGTVRTKAIPETFLQHNCYAFEVVVNPTKRARSGNLVPITGRQNIIDWFNSKAQAWGFQCLRTEIQRVEVQQFKKREHCITLEKASIKGVLKVLDRDTFIRSFQTGLGRGKAFGCGLLQIVPVQQISE